MSEKVSVLVEIPDGMELACDDWRQSLRENPAFSAKLAEDDDC